MRLAVALLLCLLAGSAHADQKADARRQELDRLFTALRSAPNEQAASLLETRIRRLWSDEASPATLLLVTRGERDLHDNQGSEALADFEDALVLEPLYVDGLVHRAAARAALGDYAGAVADIGQAVRRDPRRFSAWQALSRIAEQRGDWKGALEAWQKAMDITPMTPGGLDRLDQLQKKVDGQAT